MTARRVTGVLVATALVLGVAVVAGADTLRHSGRVIAVDRDAGTIVLDELGPWTVRRGATVTTRRAITVPPGTEFVRVQRAEDAPSGFPGDFVEVPLEPWRVEVGTFVTVEGVQVNGRLTARRVVVVPLQE